MRGQGESLTPSQQAIVRATVRRVLAFVIPGFVVLGGGLTGALYLQYLDAQQDEKQACVRGADTVDQIRATWDVVLGIFPADTPEVLEAREGIDSILPPRDRGAC